MEANPVGVGFYGFIDLAGWALELEANVVGGEYSFEFANSTGFGLPETPFAWARGSTAITIKRM
mgnify:CR=1 FL=1